MIRSTWPDGIALALEAELRPGFRRPAGILTTLVSRRPSSRSRSMVVSPALDGGEERDGQRGFGRLGGPFRARPSLAAPIAPHPGSGTRRRSRRRPLPRPRPPGAPAVGPKNEPRSMFSKLRIAAARPPSRPTPAPPARGPKGPAALERGVAELVEAGLLLGVGEDVVRVLNFLELPLGRLVAGVGVGVMLPRERARYAFLIWSAEASRPTPEDLVIIASSPSRSPYRTSTHRPS